jgi:hypothetical protein
LARARGRPDVVRDDVIQRAVVLGLVAVALVGIGYVVSGSGPFESCGAKAAHAYPVLEGVAARVMPEGTSLRRENECEEMGQPLPDVSARIRNWRTPADAENYLRAQGWHVVGWDLVSPDGTVAASTQKIITGGGKRYIEVGFALTTVG